MTYRQLLEAIKKANELQSAYELLTNNKIRWTGTTEERDNFECELNSADMALNMEIEK